MCFKLNQFGNIIQCSDTVCGVRIAAYGQECIGGAVMVNKITMFTDTSLPEFRFRTSCFEFNENT